MKTFTTALFVLIFAAATVYAEHGTDFHYSIDSAGLITLHNDGAEIGASGMEIQATGGLSSTSPAPFEFPLSNTATQLTHASIPDYMLQPGATATESFFDAAGGANEITAFAIGIGGTIPTVGPVTPPEPSAGILSVIGALGLLGFRRRR